MLSDLLESIFSQNFVDYEIVICEDFSPQRLEIRNIVNSYKNQHVGLIHYYENPKNLGYDGNIRNLIDKSNGEYCLFMGNDDLLCSDSLNTISSIVTRYKNCGVIVRSYATFDSDPNKIKQIFRYFKDEIEYKPGVNAVVAGFRRSVVIPGMVINRAAAKAIASPIFDGTLLYQLYLVGLISASRSVIFTPEIIALRRDGVAPDFGNSEVEKGKFVPGQQTPESSVNFVGGMLQIAKYIENETSLLVYKPIIADIARYSYPILSIQSNRPKKVFIKYFLDLAKLGLSRFPFFYAYFLSLLFLGSERVDSLIIYIKNKLGYTPKLGKL